MDRYHPFRTNVTSTTFMVLSTAGEASKLVEIASFFLSTGTDLLALLIDPLLKRSMNYFYPPVNFAYLPLQHNLDLPEGFHSRNSKSEVPRALK